jgi:hypothetical protein
MKKQLLTVLAAASVSLTAMAQAYIPNAGFETWGSTAGEDQQPTGWISYNVFTFSLIDVTNQNPTSVTQATGVDAYQGTYSAKITTGTLVNNPDAANIPNTAGVLMTGAVQFNSPYMRSGYGTNQRPQMFSYACKYTPVSGDSAYALVVLTHWNGSGRDTIAAGLDYLPTAVASYTVRNITLTYNAAFSNAQPDTCLILFSASATAAHDGSTLYVDALSFTGYVGIDEASASNGVDVYPNPASTLVNFDVTDADAAMVAVYDMTGREVKRVNIFNKKGSLDASAMASGMYTYSILNDKGAVVSRGKFTVGQ